MSFIISFAIFNIKIGITIWTFEHFMIGFIIMTNKSCYMTSIVWIWNFFHLFVGWTPITNSYSIFYPKLHKYNNNLFRYSKICKVYVFSLIPVLRDWIWKHCHKVYLVQQTWLNPLHFCSVKLRLTLLTNSFSITIIDKGTLPHCPSYYTNNWIGMFN